MLSLHNSTDCLMADTEFDVAYYLDTQNRIHVMGTCTTTKKLRMQCVLFNDLSKVLKNIASSKKKTHKYLQDMKCSGFYIKDLNSIVIVKRRYVNQIEKKYEPTYDRMTSFQSVSDDLTASLRIIFMLNSWKTRSAHSKCSNRKRRLKVWSYICKRNNKSSQ